MKPILEIQNITKRFKIQHETQAYLSLRDSLVSLFKPTSSSSEEFYALNDVSFNVLQGDTVGIIGKNGAGKSTLLKILSKITPPTSGKIISRGRIASLLEVGTGFHPELSGRENVFLNGSILGMKRSEILKNFDAIIEFSGVEKFIDTPLKHYSSGMQLRLAFAVAAFLENEILVIDEVLAVGDAEFQKKCMGKMKDVSQSGRTILFVSHNMGAISQICEQGVLLMNGQCVIKSHMEDVINTYLNNFENTAQIIKKEPKVSSNQFLEVFMCNTKREPKSEFKYDEEIYINVDLELADFNENYELAMRLIDRNKNPIFTIHEKLNKHYKNSNKYSLKVKLPGNFLTPNSFSWVLCINNPGVYLYDIQDDVLGFTILETGSEFARHHGANYGCVHVNYEIF